MRYSFTVLSHELKPNYTRDFPPDGRYLIGVSGGRDSVALLHWLISLGYERLIVCHLNHRLRGRSGDADARFVNRLVERYNERRHCIRTRFCKHPRAREATEDVDRNRGA